MDQVAVNSHGAFGQGLESPLRSLPGGQQFSSVAVSPGALARMVATFRRPAAVFSVQGECIAANTAARELLAASAASSQVSGGQAFPSLHGATVLGLTSRRPETHYLLLWQPQEPSLDAQTRQLVDLWRLTRRQAQVLCFLLDGRCNKAMAQEMSCAVRTVELHVSAVLEKSGCGTRAELIATAWRQIARQAGTE